MVAEAGLGMLRLPGLMALSVEGRGGVTSRRGLSALRGLDESRRRGLVRVLVAATGAAYRSEVCAAASCTLGATRGDGCSFGVLGG